MASGPPTGDVLRDLLENGSDSDVQQFLLLLTAAQLPVLLKDVPAEARRRAILALDATHQATIVKRLPQEEAVDLLDDLDPAEAGDILEDLEEGLRNRLFGGLDLEDQAEILREIEDLEAREELIEGIADADLADIAEQQLSDDATDLLEELDEERRSRVLEEMEAGKRAEVERLQKYPDDSAGGLMQTELIRLGADLTVAEAIEVVRREFDERMGGSHDLYVVDAQDRIIGRVRNRHLVLNTPDTLIGEIMVTDVRTVPDTMDQEDIAAIVQDYDLATLAVIDDEGHLLGRILVDDILDVLEEEATEDVALMAGTGASDVYTKSVVLALRSRFPWLVATFAGGILTVLLITSWEEELTGEVPLLAAAIPIIMGMSGNVGMQAATVTVRGIAVNEIDFQSLGKVLSKEFVAGLVFSLCFSAALYPILNYIVVPLTDPHMPELYAASDVMLVPAIAMCATIAAGAFTGTAVPLLLHKLGKDPAVASAPFITTTIDLLAIALLVAVKILLLSPPA